MSLGDMASLLVEINRRETEWLMHPLSLAMHTGCCKVAGISICVTDGVVWLPAAKEISRLYRSDGWHIKDRGVLAD